jgi:ectoine hydroxylase-related dioxygenase (phytanoyl-CoA dioxygenase family)
MSTALVSLLTSEQIASYEELGFVQSIPVLTPDEVLHFRDCIEKTWKALGGRVTRADGLHLYFRWAWELASHRRLLDCMEDLLGPNILLKHTRLFYKYGNSAAWVGWHQDGVTERLTDGCAPAIWLGLTEATIENGCLRVIPRSHRVGILAHYSRRDQVNVASSDTKIQEPTNLVPDENELSVKLARVPEGLDPPFDVVMSSGEMSFHHPVLLHGSNPNLSAEPRIGLSATYATPDLHKSAAAVAVVRGSLRPHDRFDLVHEPPAQSLENAATAYLASGRQILFLTSEGINRTLPTARHLNSIDHS